MTWCVVLIGLVAVERLAEVAVANRNRTWSRTQGGIEFGAGHRNWNRQPAALRESR